MTSGTLNILKQDYSLASILPFDDNLEKINIEGYETIGKAFHEDLVKLEGNKVYVINSYIETKKICGVLEFYSKTKYPPNKKGVERFRFIPFSKHYPNFIVSSKCKSKYTKNVIAVIKYLSWTDTLPYGEIIRIIGDIHDENSIYESVLYTNNLLLDKRKLENRIFKNLKELSTENFTNIMDKEVISVDPVGTKDIDDAFHYEKVDDFMIKIGIHISNVIDTLEYYRMTYILNDNLCSSVYTPTKVYNMLHEQLSTNILSLIQDKKRYAVTLWLTIKDNKIIDRNIEKTVLVNKKQYSYDEFEKCIKQGKRYYDIFQCIKNLKYKNIIYEEFDSHTFIEKLMTIYNSEIADLFISHRNTLAIFRNQKSCITCEQKNVDNTITKFLNIINKAAAEYSFENNGHISLGLNSYVHITSPIRRYVDCFNQKALLSILDKKFMFNLSIDLDMINKYQISIKKAERMFAKLKLKQILNNQIITTYIYNVDEKYMYLYLSDYKISIRKKLIEKGLENIISTNCSCNCIEITNNHTEEIITLPLLKKLNVNIFSICNSIYPKFKVTFLTQ